MAGTYSFYEKRLKSMVNYPVRGPHDCMTQPGVVHCPACMEEHEILRKHNQEMKGKGKK